MSTSSQLPLPKSNVHVYGGTETERRALTARLSRVLRNSPMLLQESIGIVILDHTVAAPEESSSSAADQQQQPGGRQSSSSSSFSPSAASSYPLAQAFLKFPLISGSLLTVFNVGERDRQRLVATQGEDVVDVRFSWFGAWV